MKIADVAFAIVAPAFPWGSWGRRGGKAARHAWRAAMEAIRYLEKGRYGLARYQADLAAEFAKGGPPEYRKLAGLCRLAATDPELAELFVFYEEMKHEDDERGQSSGP